MDMISNDECSILDALSSEMKSFGESLRDDSENTAMDGVLDVVKKLVTCSSMKNMFSSFFDTVNGLGSFQIMVGVEAGLGYGGFGIEVGLNIDIQHILSLITTGKWDTNTETSPLASVHFGYAIDAGISAGAKLGLAIGYHTSRPGGVDGFGYGVNLAASAGIGMGVVSASMHVLSTGNATSQVLFLFLGNRLASSRFTCS